VFNFLPKNLNIFHSSTASFPFKIKINFLFKNFLQNRWKLLKNAKIPLLTEFVNKSSHLTGDSIQTLTFASDFSGLIRSTGLVAISVSTLTTTPFIYKLNRLFFMYKMVFLKKYFLKENTL